MDRSNFVRNLYRIATNSLKGYEDYYGRIVNVGKPLEIPSEFLHQEESASHFLPQQSVNIDAPTEYFVSFMDYFVSMMPDLGVVFADKKRIDGLYENAVDMGIIEDDEKSMEYIEFVVGVGTQALKDRGIL